MLWRLMVVVGLVSCGGMVVRADDTIEHTEEAAIVNDVPNAWAEFKAVVDVLQPTAEAIYLVDEAGWTSGLSGSLYDFVSSDIHLGRIKIGYGSSNLAYAGLDVDLPGLAIRYLGGKWSQLDSALAVLSKYGSTGVIGGRNFASDQWDFGPTFGLSWRF